MTVRTTSMLPVHLEPQLHQHIMASRPIFWREVMRKSMAVLQCLGKSQRNKEQHELADQVLTLPTPIFTFHGYVLILLLMITSCYISWLCIMHTITASTILNGCCTGKNLSNALFVSAQLGRISSIVGKKKCHIRQMVHITNNCISVRYPTSASTQQGQQGLPLMLP